MIIMFDRFRKNRDDEVLDLRKRRIDQEIPIPNDVERRLEETTMDLSVTTVETVPEQSSEGNSNSGGGFLNFFGGSSSNETVETIPSVGVMSNNGEIDSKLSNLSDRVSRLIDRIELLERKMDRFERR